MRTETIVRTLYTFDELSDKAKDKARDWYRDGALDYDWWDYVYEDAEKIGLHITEFGLDRSRHVEGTLTKNLVDSCKAILAEHGPTCDTHKLASDFLTAYNKLDNEKDEAIRALTEQEIEDEKETELTDTFDTQVEALTEEYAYALREEYASMLQKEYDWLLSDECVDETIKANNYEFTENGQIA